MRAPPPDGVHVVHRDAQLLVLDKPAGLATTSPDDGDCLVARARVIDPDAPRLHPTSRLDADVTGLVTFARTERATRALLEARRAGTYARVYLALAGGVIQPVAGEWTWSIALDRRDPRKRKAAGPEDDEAKPSRTRFEVLETAREVTLCALRPISGRTHQLRVHAARAGTPLLGDIAYDGARRIVLADGRIVTARRVMLHCGHLEVPDVAKGGVLALSLPVPDDFARCWRELGGSSDALDRALR